MLATIENKAESAEDRQQNAPKTKERLLEDRQLRKFERVRRFATKHWTLALLFVLGGLLGLHALNYWPFLSDDALISLRYGRRLATGHGLTWTGTERVEGYTNLLWVLFAAIAQLLKRDLITTARTLDFIGAFASIAIVSLSAQEFRISALRLMSGGFALTVCAPLAVLAIGGLEHGFTTGLPARWGSCRSETHLGTRAAKAKDLAFGRSTSRRTRDCTGRRHRAHRYRSCRTRSNT